MKTTRYGSKKNKRLRISVFVLLAGATIISIMTSIGPDSLKSSAQRSQSGPARQRAREAGVAVGVLPPGQLNAITDVAGVSVGHATLIRGDNVRTGVTAILPRNEDVQSINPLVGETNDGYLNDIRGRHAGREEVFAAIRNARGGAVEEGCVGAGTGTVAFGFKGGIGTSSRKLPPSLGGYTVGVLVQTNFGGILTINGAPVGRELGRYYLKEELETKSSTNPGLANNPDGSIIIVIATDAPIDHRNLQRLAARSMMGLARTGAAGSNGSGDYAIAFSTANDLRIRSAANSRNQKPAAALLSNDAMSPLFLAVIEATEEAIYNSLFRATTMTGRGHTVEALPIDRTLEILRKHGALGH